MISLSTPFLLRSVSKTSTNRAYHFFQPIVFQAMTNKDAERLMRESEKYLGMEKPVVIKSQLGHPSTIKICKFEGVAVEELNGEVFPSARMISIEDSSQVWFEDLNVTIEFLARNNM